tara:strand:- start:471 stop:890 length:420 start_codon:yes stop_codon:yes gene_type:complete
MFSIHALLTYASDNMLQIGTTYNAFALGFEILAFLLFWFGASWLSTKMVPGEVGHQNLSGTDSGQILTLCIAVFGLVLAILSVPKIVGRFAIYLNGREGLLDFTINSYAIEFALQFLFGLFLIFGSKRVSQLIKWARTT